MIQETNTDELGEEEFREVFTKAAKIVGMEDGYRIVTNHGNESLKGQKD